MSKEKENQHSLYCEPRFVDHESRIKDAETLARGHEVILNNGLVDNVKGIRRLVWVVIGLLVGFLGSQIALFNLIIKLTADSS